MAESEGAICMACRLRPGLATAGEVFARFLARAHPFDARAFEDVCQDHPDLADELRRLFKAAESRRIEPTSTSQTNLNLAGAPPKPTSTAPQAACPSEEHPPGPRVSGNRYQIQGVVARGGMGIIYSVYDRELNRQSAMKVIGTNLSGAEPISLETLPPAWVDRFVDEAQITAQLEHPNIVPVHEIGIDAEGRIYFTMKLVQGRTLSEIFSLTREKAEGWSVTRVVSVLLRACEAVAHAHERGVVHRDLKPQNIMVGRLGEVYVMDWGLAKSVNRSDLHDLRPLLTGAQPEPKAARGTPPVSQAVRTDDSPLVTMDGTVLGTPAYMSPEHAGGWIERMGPTCDVYALGAILYELLAGHPPYLRQGRKVSAQALLKAVTSGPPDPIETIARQQSSSLVAICNKAMHRDIQARYQNAGELTRDLQAWLEGRVVRAHQTGALAELKAWILRNRLAAFSQAAGVSLLVAGLVTIIALQNRAGSKIAQGKAALIERNRDLNDALYAAATINASSAIERGDFEAAEAVLERCDPGRRGWEWHYLSRWLQSWAFPSSKSPAVIRAVLSRDASWLVSVERDQTIKVWDVATAKPRRAPIPLQEIPTALALSPDENWVAVGSTNGMLRLVNLASEETRWQVKAHTLRISSIDFSPDGTRLVSGSDDGLIQLWEVATGQRLHGLHLGGLYLTASFSPDGRTLVVGNSKSGASIFDANTFEQSRMLGDATNPQAVAAFSPDGRRIVTGGRNGTLHVWDSTTGQPAAGFEAARNNKPTTSLAWSPDGRWIASGYSPNLIQINDANSGRVRESFRAHALGWVPVLQFSHDGKWLFSSGASEGSTRFWNMQPERKITTIASHTNRVWTAAFTPDSQRVLSAGFDSVLRLSDATNGRDLQTFAGHTNSVIWSVAITPDGRRAISAGQDCNLRVWDLETGAQLRSIEAQQHPGVDNNVTLFVALSPDGSQMVSGGFDGNVQVWDVATGSRVWAARQHTNRLWSVAWSPDNRRIAASGDIGRLTLWDAQRGVELWRTNVPPAAIGTVTFSPDGTKLLSAHWSGELSLWETVSGRRLQTIPAHQGLVRSAAFSPDGRRIASAGFDQAVRLWDARLGELVLTLPKEPHFINFVAFSPDGKRLVSANDDGQVRVWQSEFSTDQNK